MRVKKCLSTLFLIGVFIFYTSNSEAQADSVRLVKAKNKLMDSICSCMTSIDSNLINTGGDIQQLFSFCLTSNMEQIKTYVVMLGIDTTTLNQSNGSKIAQQMAAEAVVSCPYLKLLANRVKSKKN